MLVSNDNPIASKILDRLSSVLPMIRVLPSDILNGEDVFSDKSPVVIFINQLDMDSNEEYILRRLRQRFPETKIIALHTHTTPALKAKTISFGYDGYLSLFELGDKTTDLLKTLGVKINA